MHNVMQARTVPSPSKTVHMKCARLPNLPFLVLSSWPRTQCHTARRLYVSRIANFRSNSRPQIRGSEQGCELPPMRQGRRIGREHSPVFRPAPQRQELERLVCSASYDRALGHTSPPFFDPSPRTQCHTSATSLRKQPSKLPFKLPTPNTGQRTGM